MTRNQIILKLIKYSVDRLFVVYGNFSDEELREEYNQIFLKAEQNIRGEPNIHA